MFGEWVHSYIYKDSRATLLMKWTVCVDLIQTLQVTKHKLSRFM